MNYTFFIQQTKRDNSSKVPSDKYRFMLLPDNSRVSIPPEDYKRLMTINSIQTFLNLELSDKNRPSFKGSYIKVGTKIYPLIVVTTDKDGAFRVPFGPGQSGLEDMKRTFREIQIAFKRFDNRRMAQLQSNSAPRIGTGEPAKEEVDLFEKEMKGMNDGEAWTPKPSNASKAGIKSPTRETTSAPVERSRAQQSPQRMKGRAADQTPKKPANKSKSGTPLIRAVLMGAAISVGIIGVLTATGVAAAESVPSEEAGSTYTSADEPGIDLNIIIATHKPVAAATSEGCSLGRLTNSTSQGEPFKPTGFEGLQQKPTVKE